MGQGSNKYRGRRRALVRNARSARPQQRCVREPARSSQCAAAPSYTSPPRSSDDYTSPPRSSDELSAAFHSSRRRRSCCRLDTSHVTNAIAHTPAVPASTAHS